MYIYIYTYMQLFNLSLSLYIYIYIYIYYRCEFAMAGATTKRGLEGGVWAATFYEIYGSKRDKSVFDEYLQEIAEHLQKPPGVYGIM